jgi:hypothetical protein
MEFLGLSIADWIAAAKTVWLLRDNLTKLVAKVCTHFVEVGQIVAEYSSRKSRSEAKENT